VEDADDENHEADESEEAREQPQGFKTVDLVIVRIGGIVVDRNVRADLEIPITRTYRSLPMLDPALLIEKIEGGPN
jgi:hypothetical protein